MRIHRMKLETEWIPLNENEKSQNETGMKICIGASRMKNAEWEWLSIELEWKSSEWEWKYMELNWN